MSIDALPEFLIDALWTPLLYVGGLLWCMSMVVGLLGAVRRISKSFGKGGDA